MGKGNDEEKIERAPEAVRAFLCKKAFIFSMDDRLLQSFKKATGVLATDLDGCPHFDDDRVIHEGNKAAVDDLAERAKTSYGAWEACVYIMEKLEHFEEEWPPSLGHLALEGIRGNKPKGAGKSEKKHRNRIIRRAVEKAKGKGGDDLSYHSGGNAQGPTACDIVSEELLKIGIPLSPEGVKSAWRKAR